MSEPIYIETWKVSGNPKGDRLGIAYTSSQCPTYSHLLALRDNMAEWHSCKLEHLIRTDTIVLNNRKTENSSEKPNNCELQTERSE